MIFNAQWAAKAKPLASKMAAFFVAIYKVGAMTAEDLKVEPGISNTQEVVTCWRQIITNIHPEFVRETTAFSVSLFSSPQLELELSSQLRKKRHEHQQAVFNKLQAAAMTKLRDLDEFVGLQVDIRFYIFCERIKGSELNRLIREGPGPTSQAMNPSAPPPPRSSTYKPNETFIEGRRKSFPWYTVGSTSVPAEEKDAIRDYLNSGRDFSNVSVPVIYIKRLFDNETLKIFLPSLDEAINQGKRHCTKTIVIA